MVTVRVCGRFVIVVVKKWLRIVVLVAAVVYIISNYDDGRGGMWW